MRQNQLVWIVPVLLLAGCSKSSAPEQAAAPPPTASQPPATSQPPAAASPLGSTEPTRHGSPVAATPAARAQLTVPAGTKLVVRIDSSLSTKTNDAGDRFTATLEEPIVVEGRTVAPRGTTCTGHITQAAASGRMEGKADL